MSQRPIPDNKCTPRQGFVIVRDGSVSRWRTDSHSSIGTIGGHVASNTVDCIRRCVRVSPTCRSPGAWARLPTYDSFSTNSRILLP